MGQFEEQFDHDRLARFRGEDPVMVPVVSEDLLGDAALPTQDSYEWFTETKEKRAPNWENEVTLKTAEMLREYAPIDYIDRVSPTPLLMIIAEQDPLRRRGPGLRGRRGGARTEGHRHARWRSLRRLR